MATVTCPKCAHTFETDSRDNPAAVLRNAVAERARAKNATTAHIAERLGISQPYLANLLALKDKLDPKVLKHWMSACDRGAVHVSFQEMRSLASTKAKDAQSDAYDRLVEKTRTRRAAERDAHSQRRKKKSASRKKA